MTFTFDRPFIDAHHHLWDLSCNPYPWLQDDILPGFRYGDYSALRRSYLAEDYRSDTVACRPRMTVHMEAEWLRQDPVAETRWLSGIANSSGFPHAIVAYADLGADNAAEVLAQQAAFHRVRGIRQKPVPRDRGASRRCALPGSMDDSRWREGYALLQLHGLSFDLQVTWWNLDQAADLARDFPQTPIILNHTGLPSDRSVEGLAGWRKAMELLAREPNAFLKISGLGLAGRPWTQEANIPLIRDALAIFGVQRCMFASNFPVDRLVAGYGQLLQGFVTAIQPLPQMAQQAVLHDNAMHIYRLNTTLT